METDGISVGMLIDSSSCRSLPAPFPWESITFATFLSPPPYLPLWPYVSSRGLKIS